MPYASVCPFQNVVRYRPRYRRFPRIQVPCVVESDKDKATAIEGEAPSNDTVDDYYVPIKEIRADDPSTWRIVVIFLWSIPFVVFDYKIEKIWQRICFILAGIFLFGYTLLYLFGAVFFLRNPLAGGIIASVSMLLLTLIFVVESIIHVVFIVKKRKWKAALSPRP